MKLTALTEALGEDRRPKILQGTADKDIEKLSCYSKDITPGSAFFAISGSTDDGKRYITEATARGAHVVIIGAGESCPAIDPAVTVLQVEDVRKAMALMSAAFYDYPCRKLLTIGVTGTKGKTTTAAMIQAILLTGGKKTGMIGTVQNGWPGCYTPADRTTPQSIEIQRLCRQMVDAGCEAVVMEVSSQGLMQHRVYGITFDYGLFTNISPDHIGAGEHRDFAEYLYWKSRLFCQCRTAVMHADDPHWREMLGRETPENLLTFGRIKQADYRLIRSSPHRSGAKLLTRCRLSVREEGSRRRKGRRLLIAMAGAFNGENAAGAVALCRDAGVSWQAVHKALREISVRGRTEVVDIGGGFTVLVDYAHNGMALKRLLTDLRAYRPKRLTVVFGCGGQRDHSRRAEMGRVAGEMADLTVITSDNPRNERPEEIIEEIRQRVEEVGGKYMVIADRAEAIDRAIAQAVQGEILIIAGKGHETYQLIGAEKRIFDDRAHIRRKQGKKKR